MPNSRELEAKRTSYRSVLGIVKAMKALSAANVRKGGAALAHTREYRDFVSGAASEAAAISGVGENEPGVRRLVCAFGSQYGLCGPMNDHVAEGLGELLDAIGGADVIIAVGGRLGGVLNGSTVPAPVPFEGPGSVDGIGEVIGGLLEDIYERYSREEFDELYFVYPVYSADSLDVKPARIIPPSFENLPEDHEPPLTQLTPLNLMDGVFEEYIFIAMYATALEAVIAENESRMRAMEQAEKNIGKKISEVTLNYNYAFQEEVTSELIEIIGGFEALGGMTGP